MQRFFARIGLIVVLGTAPIIPLILFHASDAWWRALFAIYDIFIALAVIRLIVAMIRRGAPLIIKSVKYHPFVTAIMVIGVAGVGYVGPGEWWWGIRYVIRAAITLGWYAAAFLGLIFLGNMMAIAVHSYKFHKALDEELRARDGRR